MEVFGGFGNSVGSNRKCDHQIRHRRTVGWCGICKRPSHRIKCHIGIGCRRGGRCCNQASVVTAVGIDVGDAQLNSDDFAGLEYSIKRNRVIGRGAFCRNRRSNDRPLGSIVVNNRRRHNAVGLRKRRAQTGGTGWIGKHQPQTFVAFDRQIVDRSERHVEIIHRPGSIADKRQERTVPANRSRIRRIGIVSRHRRVDRSVHVRIIGAGRFHINNIELNGRRFTQLQISGQANSERDRIAFGDRRRASDRPLATWLGGSAISVGILDRREDIVEQRIQSDHDAGVASHIGQGNVVDFRTFEERIVDCAQVDHKPRQRVAVCRCGERQRSTIPTDAAGIASRIVVGNRRNDCCIEARVVGAIGVDIADRKLNRRVVTCRQPVCNRNGVGGRSAFVDTVITNDRERNLICTRPDRIVDRRHDVVGHRVDSCCGASQTVGVAKRNQEVFGAFGKSIVDGAK